MSTHETTRRPAKRKRRPNYRPVIFLALVCAAIFAAGYCVGVRAADKAAPTLQEPVQESTSTPEPTNEPSEVPSTEEVLWRDDIVTDGNLLDYDLQVTMQACCEEYGVPYAEALSTVFGSRFQRTMHNIGEGAWIGGKCWVFPYYDQNGELAFQRFPADEVLPFWADADHTILDAAVHVYVVLEYDETEQTKDVVKVEVMHGGGVDCFIRRDDGTLEPDDFARSGPYITNTDPQTGEETSYNWERIPLVCFKSSHHEIPLLSRVRCLQDAYNNIISNFANQMEEDIHSTILVIKNYDGEDLGRLRANLATYGVIKVRSFEGSEGGVDTLQIEVNAENYKVLLSMLKDAIIENARGYDAKDERMSGNPNQMNIQSMYSDIDLDANGIEMEFQASMEELLWFVNKHLANTGRGSFDGTEVKVIFDRDVLINETEVINNCKNSVGILSDETIVKMHPWVSDPEQELQRIKDEKEEAMADPYQAAFMKNRQNGGDGSGNPVTDQNGGGGNAEE